MAKAGCIVGSRKDGLGARLLMMLNCFKIAEQFGVEPFFYWPTKDSVAINMEHPEKLFSDQMMTSRFLSKDRYDELGRDAAPLWKFLADKNPKRLKRHLLNGGNLLVEEGFEIVLFPWEEDEAVRGTYRSYFDQIELVDILKERCSLVDETLSKGEAGSVAYHLRRGDILDTKPWMHTVWPSKVEPDEYYEAHLEKEPEKTALIFSDCQASIDRLQAQFPNLNAIGDIAPLEGLDPEQRDFLELYAMSKVDNIIAPILSAYSTAAARISGRQRLRFKEVLSDAEMTLANAKAADRLLNRPESYFGPSDMAHAYSRVAVHLATPDGYGTASAILETIKNEGSENAFIDVFHAVSQLHEEKWGMAAGYARAAAANPNIWPDDFVSARSVEVVCYASSGQRRKAGIAFREAFLFKPLSQDVCLAGTHLLLNFMINQNNFLPFDGPILRQLRLKATEDNSSTYLVGKVINKKLRKDLRSVALDWHSLVLDGKASRLKDDQAQLKKMRDRLDAVPEEVMFKHALAYQSMKGLVQCYLGDLNARKMVESAAEEQADNPLYAMRLADVLLAADDQKGALRILRGVSKLSQDNPLYVHKLGLVLSEMGKKQEAADLLGQAAAWDAAPAKMLGDYAMSAYRVGDGAAALKAMQKAFDKVPVFGKFQNQLARIRNSV
ncbi:hypothetical protein SAMN05444003_2317 [Cognatiyoonia sediminum]|uniref:Uncharacterized protein n=1 Tax=Cognatiyoonia sediminum TaxID=1508389 RepID=A0A1M5QUW9_9RHOB|nr:hypothetical protein [Cognatiyoonia sediminum]SHH17509.1 hypothetical protein SAMN05444003_2317 [Cognatiyoonia sediminum]